MSSLSSMPEAKRRRARRAILVASTLTFVLVEASFIACKTKANTAATDAGGSSALGLADAGQDAADASAHAALAKPAPKPASSAASELDPPPEARTSRPADWSNAEEAPFNGAHHCTALMKREWFKITCPDSASVALLAGSSNGVDLDVTDASEEEDAGESFGPREAHPAATAIFPVRRGDRRVLQFNGFKQGFNGGYSGEPDEQLPGPTLSELWLEDQRGPQIQLDE